MAPSTPGAPDRGDKASPRPRDCYWPPHADGMDPKDAVVRVKDRNFR
ncbi:hypothetical protein [Sphingomonas sp.]